MPRHLSQHSGCCIRIFFMAVVLTFDVGVIYNMVLDVCLTAMNVKLSSESF